ncbi:Rha family transcriptional regulator [Nitratireductor sp. GISD-1A_MAKvit]|uniref:Rha family transcriptional regulator n=1 Tax=Nitratireductor sp. GISD-1A_MAKvit TaxID=3234198 RepID=UPI00346640DD
MTIKDGKVFANSRDVAEFFGKQHMHVLRDIDALIESAPEASSNFGLCPYQAVAGGRMYRAFDMTRDGLTLLAMGFTSREVTRVRKGIPTSDNDSGTLSVRYGLTNKLSDDIPILS